MSPVKYMFAIVAFLTLLSAGAVEAATTFTVVTGGDEDTSGVCQPFVCTLRDAIVNAADGDTITFAPSIPSVITLTQGPLGMVGKSLTINGPGASKLAISGGQADAVISILPGILNTVITINNLTIADGAVTGDSGADGVQYGSSGDVGQSANGGCIFVASGTSLTLNFDVVTNCTATGGNGGNGMFGMKGANGGNGEDGTVLSSSGKMGGPGSRGQDGGDGGNGGTAYGGAIFSLGILALNSTSVINSHTYSGTGGNGAPGGYGGRGGNGGSCNACIGGIVPGFGGNGGNGGDGGNEGNGGVGGDSFGGGVFAMGSALFATNTTISNNSSVAGFSGTHQQSQPSSGGPGGHFGYGATAVGYVNGSSGTPGADGLLGMTYAAGRAMGGGGYSNITGTLNFLTQCTVANNSVYSGSDTDSQAASVEAGGVFNQGNSMTVWNSIVANNLAGTYDTKHPNNCQANPAFNQSNDNLDNGILLGFGGCGFDVHAFAQDIFIAKNGDYSSVTPGNWGGNGLPVLMIQNGSPAQGGAAVHGTFPNQTGGCTTSDGQSLPDERGVTRPQGTMNHPAACDLGAVQNDIIFRDGFGN